jgi:hypothetical protein
VEISIIFTFFYLQFSNCFLKRGIVVVKQKHKNTKHALKMQNKPRNRLRFNANGARLKQNKHQTPQALHLLTSLSKIKA